MIDILTLNNIFKTYSSGTESIDVIKDFSLTLKRGDTTAITGPSGTGKSTLLNIMSGLEKPTAGKVLFEGRDLYSLESKELDTHRNLNVGLVFQFHYLLDDFTAYENVMIPALLAGSSQKDAAQRARELLDKVGLSDRLNHLPKEMSGGEQQRAAVARALMNNPRLVFADEPTGNLDKTNSSVIEDLLLSLGSDGITVIIVTHDMDFASRCAKNIQLQKV